MSEEKKDEIIKRLDEIEQKISEYFYMSQEDKKRIDIESEYLDIPENIKTLAIPTMWTKYKFHYFNNPQFKYVLKIDAYPGDNWISLHEFVHGEVVVNEKEVDLGTSKIKEFIDEYQKDVTIEGKYLTFERNGKEWYITKNPPEAYVYRLVLKDFVAFGWCSNDIHEIDINNAFTYKAICIGPLKELRLYMVLPTRENTKIYIRHNEASIPLPYGNFIVSWNNGDPIVVREIENKI